MICRNKRIKIVDLGVSRQVSQETMMLNTFYGTPLYLSPEIIQSKPYNEKTDIWSLGVILYELACLYPPFRGNSIFELAQSVVKGQYPEIPAHYSNDLARCVRWMLNVDFSKRPSISQLIRYIESRRKLKDADYNVLVDSDNEDTDEPKASSPVKQAAARALSPPKPAEPKLEDRPVIMNVNDEKKSLESIHENFVIDVNKLQAMIRREQVKIRRLLQSRDYIHTATVDGSELSMDTDRSVENTLKEAKTRLDTLERALNTGGRIDIITARR